MPSLTPARQSTIFKYFRARIAFRKVSAVDPPSRSVVWAELSEQLFLSLRDKAGAARKLRDFGPGAVCSIRGEQCGNFVTFVWYSVDLIFDGFLEYD